MPHADVPFAGTQTASSDILTYAFDGPQTYDREKKPLFIKAEDASQYLTAEQTLCLTRKLIAGLKHVGIKPGDRVLVHLPNTIAYTPIVFGIIGAGATYTASNPAYRAFELERLLNLSRPSVVITTSELLQVVAPCAEKHNLTPPFIYVFDCLEVAQLLPQSVAVESAVEDKSETENNSNSTRSFLELLKHGECDWHRIPTKVEAKNTDAVILLTSGTTGYPKLALFSHFAIIGMIDYMFQFVERNVVRLMSLPMFLAYGFLMTHIPSLKWGAPAYIMERFHPERFLDAIQQYQITDITPVSFMVAAWGKQPEAVRAKLVSARMIFVLGGATSEKTYQTFKSILNPQARIMNGWGMTETGPLTVTGPEDPYNSIGRIFPGQEIKLVGARDQTVLADDEPGEAYVRSWCGIRGYRQADGSVELPLDEQGWFRTGDILTRKGPSYFFIGRSKELIKVKGWQVAPAEVESLLMTHPLVADCAVVGVRIEEELERPRAYVVLKPDTTSGDPDGVQQTTQTAIAAAQTIYDLARQNLAGYKALEGGVYIVSSIPRNAFQKIQRFLLPDSPYLERFVPARKEIAAERVEVAVQV